MMWRPKHVQPMPRGVVECAAEGRQKEVTLSFNENVNCLHQRRRRCDHDEETGLGVPEGGGDMGGLARRKRCGAWPVHVIASGSYRRVFTLRLLHESSSRV
jgi:hypothetical protein